MIKTITKKDLEFDIRHHTRKMNDHKTKIAGKIDVTHNQKMLMWHEGQYLAYQDIYRKLNNDKPYVETED